MIEVTSKNRNVAKKLLNNWHDSRKVRTWTLAQLSTAIMTAINEDLVTLKSAQRALAIEPTPPPRSDCEQEAGEQEQEQASEEQKKEDDSGDGKDSESQQDAPAETPPPPGVDLDAIQEMIDQSIDKHRDADGHAVRKVVIKAAGETKEVKGAHHMFPDVLAYIMAGLNVALVGPAGSGKSTIAKQVAAHIGLEFRGCGALLSKYELVGYKDAGGTYHESPLYDAFTRGHLFCFDELDGSSPDAVVAFNAITDNQNVYAFPDGMHPKHEKFVAVACMNTWGNGADADYVGRFKQDAASMSRFVRVMIDYDTSIEEQLGDKDIVSRVWKLRKGCAALGIRHVVSTRMIVQAQAARDVGLSKDKIDRDVLFAGLNESAIMQLAAHMVSK